MRTPGTAWVVVALFLVTPSVVFAQASITGTVRDTSGAVLPGVTVEATSPALIEKARTATTDGNGQYRIVDLRAGQYTVTFTLPGFSTVKREGIALEGTFTATINADMRVGELTETITVTGESPIVDVQSVRRQMVLDNEIISAIPVLAVVQQPDSADSEQHQSGRCADGRPGGARYGGVWRIRRAVQRGARQRRWHQRRLGIQRRRRVVVHRRRRRTRARSR